MPTKTNAKYSVKHLKDGYENLLTDEGQTSIQHGGASTSKTAACCAGRSIVFWVGGLLLLGGVAGVAVFAATGGFAKKNTCMVTACSESQGPNASNNDGGTNECNMVNLFCNSDSKNPNKNIACAPIKTDLDYDITYMECGRYTANGAYLQHDCQEFATTCLTKKQSADSVLETLLTGNTTVLAGKPKDYAHDSFVKFSTCPGSTAADKGKAHTMAQSTITFPSNSCDDVRNEILSRANAQHDDPPTWTDPHNKGLYTVLESGNPIVIKRRTGDNKYTDKMTFSLE